MSRLSLPFVAAAFAAAAASVAQDAAPRFRTASITQSSSAGAPITRLRPNGGFEARNATLVNLIEFAFQKHPFDTPAVTGGPPWVATDRFDVVATLEAEHVPDVDGLPRGTLAALQALLADRFRLKLHEEGRTRPVYELRVLREGEPPGPKMRATDVDCGAVMRGERPPVREGGGPPCSMKTPPGRLFANTVSMATVASLLSRHLDRPVVDRTGLPGRYDIELEAQEIKAPPDYKPGPSDLTLPPAAGPSIFIAVREQLGLELRPAEGETVSIVIDGAERP